MKHSNLLYTYVWSEMNFYSASTCSIMLQKKKKKKKKVETAQKSTVCLITIIVEIETRA